MGEGMSRRFSTLTLTLSRSMFSWELLGASRASLLGTGVRVDDRRFMAREFVFELKVPVDSLSP